MNKFINTLVIAKFSFCILIAIVLSSSHNLLFAQTQGGPDTYGYIWKNSNDSSADAPVYSWIDITTIGTEITGLGDDNNSISFPIGFDFKYYWTDVSNFCVGSNGYIALDACYTISSGGNGFPPTPTVDGNENVVAPFMSDLKFDGAGNPSKAYYYTNDIDTLIITYENVAFWKSGVAPPNDWQGSNTFQVIFAKTDSSITFQYKKQQGSWAPSYDLTTYPGVTGIENITEQIGLLVSTTKPDTLMAIKFYYPQNTTFTVTDVKPSWTNNPTNAGFFEVVNRSTNLYTNVSNVGNVDINTAFNATVEIKRSNLSIAYTEVVNIPSLAQANNSTVFYPTVYTPDITDVYTITTSTNLSSDMNTANDQIKTEMVVVDTTGQTEVTLSWDNNIIPGQGVGFEGCGVHYIPPFYPVDVKELLYYVIFFGTGDSSGFVATLWDDDGPGGTAGTVLFSDTIIPDSVIYSNWSSVKLPVPVTITDGGFYISWQFIDTTLTQGNGVAVDLTPPFSLRSYEVLSGVWGAYRSAASEDIMINAVISLPVSSPVPPIANFTQSSNAICIGDSILFSNSSVGADSIQWTFPGGTPLSDTAQNTMIIYDSAGAYTATLIAWNSAGSDTITRIVDISAIPVAGFTLNADTIFTAYDDILFTTNNSTGAISYLWDFGDGITSTAEEPYHIYTTGGSYSVILKVTSLCTSDYDTLLVFVCVPPIANFTFAPSSGDSVSFTSSTLSANSWLWDFGDGSPLVTDTNPTHVYSTDSTYNVMLIVSDICGPDTIIKAVNFICVLPNAIFTGPAEAFAGDNVSFNGIFSQKTDSWLWDFGDGGSDSVVAPNHVYPITGTFTVILIASNICGSDTMIKLISICNAPPVADFTFTISGGDTVSFTSVPSSATSWLWNFGDGSPISSDTNPTHVYADTGTFDVILIASNICGSDTTTKQIIITPAVGIVSNSKYSLVLGQNYPNPADKETSIHYSLDKTSDVTFTLSNIIGKEVKKYNFSNVPAGKHKLVISTNNLNPGIYFYSMKVRGNIITRKMVITE